MFKRVVYKSTSALVCLFALMVAAAQLSAQAQSSTAPKAPTRADILRGEYGRYRANNDLLFYHLDVRVDPQKQYLSGKNSIRFRMLKDDTRIQLDLYANLNVDEILLKGSGAGGQGSENQSALLKYERDLGAVFVDFRETSKTGRVYTIDFYYSGTPKSVGRFGGFTFGVSGNALKIKRA